jgi:competence protein ComEC
MGEWVPRAALLRPVAVVSLGVVLLLYRSAIVSAGAVFVALCVLGFSSGAHVWHQQLRVVKGECRGVATVRIDPTFRSYGTATVLEFQHKRYKVLAYGPAGRHLAQRLVGESVRVVGECSVNEGAYSRFDRINHVVGRMNVSAVSETFSEGSMFERAANRMRRSLVRGVEVMPTGQRALFTGLVIGDDRDQSPEMLQRFRNSGLSHLCAVSGQNVAYLLIVVSPLLERRSRWMKWCITMLLLVWFVVLTRAEPSVLRAAFMAAMVASNALLKSPANAREVLSRAIVVLLLIDPMLAWSVGFALSVGATAGLAWASAGIGRMVGSRGVLAATLAAQLGTAPVSLLVFGFVPVISLVANPFAIPVAGFVMTIGLPVALLASAVPVLVPVVSWLLVLPVAWVDAVSHVASHLSPRGWWNGLLWALVTLGIVLRARRNAQRHTAVAG